MKKIKFSFEAFCSLFPSEYKVFYIDSSATVSSKGELYDGILEVVNSSLRKGFKETLDYTGDFIFIAPDKVSIIKNIIKVYEGECISDSPVSKFETGKKYKVIAGDPYEFIIEPMLRAKVTSWRGKKHTWFLSRLSDDCFFLAPISEDKKINVKKKKRINLTFKK